jgi:carbonic anhydrase
MSQSCNFPINIDTTEKAENCNMYCDYKYEYNDSSCVVYNLGQTLKIKYDLKSDGTVSQAFLNKKKYNVSGIQIFQPSRNTYKGVRADIELIISHEGDNKEQLLVSIPFVVSAGSSSSSNLKSGGIVLDNIINEFVKQSAGRTVNQNEGYQININNFNLNNFIPNTPYYFFYVDTASCKQSNIVFDMLKSGQTISQTAVDKLNTALIKNRVQSLYPAITKQTLYVNSNGPNFQGKATDDKIYIDCQPTGEEGKELYKQTKDDIGSESRAYGAKLVNSLMESGSVQFILAIVLGIIVLSVGKRAFTRT